MGLKYLSQQGTAEGTVPAPTAFLPEAHENTVTVIRSASAAPSTILTGSDLSLYDLRTNTCIKNICVEDGVVSADLDADARRAVISDSSGDVVVWDLRSSGPCMSTKAGQNGAPPTVDRHARVWGIFPLPCQWPSHGLEDVRHIRAHDKGDEPLL